MSAAKIPAASAIAAPSAPLAPLTVDELVEQLKGRSATELFKIIKAATTLAEKASKVPTKKGTKKAAKKDSDVPLSPEDAEKAAKRGAQLDKPRAWVTFVGNDARANGWPAFPAKVTATDKLTKVKTESIVEMPASEEQNGAHVFPDGKAFHHKHAMSLSKAYWVAKTQTGSRQDLYAEFEAQYVAPVRGVSAEGASAEGASAAASETEDTEDIYDELQAPSAAAAAPAPKPKADESKPKAAESKPKAAESKPKAAESKPKKSALKPKKATADVWVAPANGKFAPWTFNGRAVRRNKDNYVVGKDVDGEDEWLGQYNPATNEIEECDVPEDFTA
jgi:hypothetical protein